jgi:CDP-diacylglycerol--glycerol-3-phosphate 3-phosphatidyltransferase
MKPKQLVPALVSSLRIAALPLFIFNYSGANIAACLGLMVFCAATDYLDGYVARKLDVTTRAGAYFDASADFILMIGIYVFFTFGGLYPVWLVGIIVAAFAQFIITSLVTKKLYDPVGKFFGSALYIGVALSLLLPFEVTFLFVQYAFLGFFLVSLASRIISLTRKPAKP